MADPAPGRLGLGGPAVRTAPHRHARMVAANGAAVLPARQHVDSTPARTAQPDPTRYLVMVMTVKSWVDPYASVVTRTVALP